jgi:hypothetical protein
MRRFDSIFSYPRTSSTFGLLLALAFAPACTEVPSSEGEGEGESGSESETGETGEPDGLAQETTWHQHIAPLLTEKCSGCHRDGGIGPFALNDYEQAATFAELSLGAIESGQMPPWGQDETEECVPRHGFKHDPRLSDDQLELFADWIGDGKLEGDPATAAELPVPPSLELDDADLRLTTPAIEISPGNDQFWCFVLDPEFTDTTFVDATQITAGNDSIVHHVLIYLDETGQSEQLAGDDGRYECFGGPGLGQPTLIAAWAPGVPPNLLPDQVAMNIPVGSKLVVNVHYHPTGEVQTDPGTSLDIRLEKGAPLYFGQLALIGNFGGSLGGGMGLQPGPNDQTDNPEFRIPSGVDDHTETMIFRIPPEFPPLKIWSVGSHMHYVGTDMLIGLDRVEPEAGTGIDQDCLVQTPNYSFEWQRGYAFDAPLDEVPTALPGDFLYLRCKFNNSMSNPYVVDALGEQGLDAPVDVYLGEETLDEMCLGVFGVAYSIVP